VLPTALPLDTACASTNFQNFKAVDNPLLTNQWFKNQNDTVPYKIGNNVSLPVANQKTWFLGFSKEVYDSLDIYDWGNNPQLDHGTMFNITAKKDVEIKGIAPNFYIPFLSTDTFQFKVYFIPNAKYQSNLNSPSAWILNDSLAFTANGWIGSIAAKFNINPISIKKGETFAFYLEYQGLLRDDLLYFLNDDLKLSKGIGLDSPFSNITNNM